MRTHRPWSRSSGDGHALQIAVMLLLAVVAALLASCTRQPSASAPASAGTAGAAPASATSTSAATAPRSPGPAYDAELTGFPYPHPVYQHQVTAQGQTLRMAYMDVAPPPTVTANGRVVVLLHGKNFNGSHWEPTIQALTAAGYRVVIPDQIGFGKSSKPAAFQFTFQALASATVGLLDELGVRRAAVVGHSMGGMLAVRLALMHPGRVERLVLVNPLGLEDWKTMAAYQTVDELYAKELKATPESIREYQAKAYFAGAWKPEYDALIAAQAGWTRHPDYPRVAWDAALTAEMIFTQPVLYEFPQLQPSTLLIIGQRDRTAIAREQAPPAVRERMGDYPSLGRAAAKAIPHAQLVELPEAGHLPQVQDFPAYAATLIGFLNGPG